MVQEPEPGLPRSQRQLQAVGARVFLDPGLQRAVHRLGRCRGRVLGLRPRISGGCTRPHAQQLRRSSGLKDCAQRDRESQLLLQSSYQGDGEQRVSTEREEVVVGPHARHSEHLAHHIADGPLPLGLGLPRTCRDLRLRQGCDVDLAVGGQRDLLDLEDPGGDHVLRQQPGRGGPEVLRAG